MTLVREVSYCPSVFFHVSRCEPEIGAIEKWKQPSFLRIFIHPSRFTMCSIRSALSILLRATHFHYVRDFPPLFSGRITTGWVVGGHLQNNHRILWRIVQIFAHSLEIKTFSFRVPISIGSSIAKTGTFVYVFVIVWGKKSRRCNSLSLYMRTRKHSLRPKDWVKKIKISANN